MAESPGTRFITPVCRHTGDTYGLLDAGWDQSHTSPSAILRALDWQIRGLQPREWVQKSTPSAAAFLSPERWIASNVLFQSRLQWANQRCKRFWWWNTPIWKKSANSLHADRKGNRVYKTGDHHGQIDGRKKSIPASYHGRYHTIGVRILEGSKARVESHNVGLSLITAELVISIAGPYHVLNGCSARKVHLTSRIFDCTSLL